MAAGAGIPDQYNIPNGKVFIPNYDNKFIGFYYPDEDEVKTKGKITNIQLTQGDKVYTYEPYSEPSTTILPTPNGLPGIPVTSGGNYTAPDGQQWVCDSIEWDRLTGQKEYVQRAIKLTLDETRAWAKSNEGYKYYTLIPGLKTIDITIQSSYIGVMSSHFIGRYWTYGNDKSKSGIALKYTAKESDSGIALFDPSFKSMDAFKAWISENPVECIAVLETPIRHQLTADQIKALESLHTFSPTSIISNDQGADMQVIYAADTKAYIDSKFDALSKTILDAIGGK